MNNNVYNIVVDLEWFKIHDNICVPNSFLLRKQRR